MAKQLGALFSGTPNVTGDKLDEINIITNADGETQKTGLVTTDTPQTIDTYKSFTKAISAPNINYVDLANSRLAVVGDSIPYGIGSSSGSLSWFDYISALGVISHDKLAVSGACVTEISARPDLSTQVALIPSNATFIFVHIGINDYLDNTLIGDVNAVLAKTYASLVRNATFVEAYRQNLETIKRNFPDAQIMVVTPLRTSTATMSGKIYDLKFYVDAEIAVANFLDIPVFNAYEYGGIWYDSALIPDGIHPNDAGYMLLAKNIFRGMVNPISESYDNKQYEVVTTRLEIESYTDQLFDFKSNYSGVDKRLRAFADANGVIVNATDFGSATPRILILNSTGGAVWAGGNDLSPVSVVRNMDTGDISSSAVHLTKATLNATYPSAKQKFIVTAVSAGEFYIKLDNSSSGNWFVGSGVLNT